MNGTFRESRYTKKETSALARRPGAVAVSAKRCRRAPYQDQLSRARQRQFSCHLPSELAQLQHYGSQSGAIGSPAMVMTPTAGSSRANPGATIAVMPGTKHFHNHAKPRLRGRPAGLDQLATLVSALGPKVSRVAKPCRS